MRILLFTDSWAGLVNGVSTTLTNVVEEAQRQGHKVDVIEPSLFNSMPAPFYSEISLAIPFGMDDAVLYACDNDLLVYDAVHIATEGPVGLAGRHWCHKHGFKFCTSFHTMFPDYLWKYFWLPKTLSWEYLRWFHSAGERCLVPSAFTARVLYEKGFAETKVVQWARAIDHDKFYVSDDDEFIRRTEPPIVGYVGRLSYEKNIDEFIDVDLGDCCEKIVVGDGPDRDRLVRRAMRAERRGAPETIFFGRVPHDELPNIYRSLEALVFPSRTDTFGLVMLEAIACGCPVVAPRFGPALEIVIDGRNGALYDKPSEIRAAVERASALDRYKVAEFATTCTWESATNQWLKELSFACN